MKNNYNRTKKQYRNERPDHQPGHRMEFERNRRKIIASQDICALCGQPVDKSLKYPHPMCATVDHIIPVSKSGHPSALENLQLAHLYCNRQKWDKLRIEVQTDKQIAEAQANAYDADDPRSLPYCIEWTRYRSADADGNGGNYELLKAEAQRLRDQGFVLTAKGILPAKSNIPK